MYNKIQNHKLHCHKRPDHSLLQTVEAIKSVSYSSLGKTCINKNSSADEIANVNFLYDDILHALQNTIRPRLVHS